MTLFGARSLQGLSSSGQSGVGWALVRRENLRHRDSAQWRRPSKRETAVRRAWGAGHSRSGAPCVFPSRYLRRERGPETPGGGNSPHTVRDQASVTLSHRVCGKQP